MELKLRDTKEAASLALAEGRKIVRSADALISFETPLERALLQYKLGIEVMLPEIREQIKAANELRLQKELCRFLIERGVFTIGTKFGRSETDLFAEEQPIGSIIETKVVRQNPTTQSVIAAFAQLTDYMAGSPLPRRGILVFYNLSPTVVFAPRQWFHGRYWILPINLQETPPSRRKRTLNIAESNDDSMIKIWIDESSSHGDSS